MQPDFVIEGYVDPTEPLRDEGPFGDHTRYAGNPKHEIRDPNRHGEVSSMECGLRTSFGLRHSEFGSFPHVTAITHRKDAVYPATIVGIPPMEDFYIGGASVKLFLPIFKMNFPEIVDLALPAEGVFHNLVFASIKRIYPMQASKSWRTATNARPLRHGAMMFTK